MNNIQAAKDQQKALRAYIEKSRPFFQRIPPIPDTSTNKVTNADFAKQLRNTVVSTATGCGTTECALPRDYYFTFESQKKLMIFDPGSLDKLAVQLGEIKALCDILFAARMNSLDNIQRETVSTNDNNAPDYLAQKTVSLPLADLAPYKVTFRCFSTELAWYWAIWRLALWLNRQNHQCGTRQPKVDWLGRLPGCLDKTPPGVPLPVPNRAPASIWSRRCRACRPGCHHQAT